MPQVFRGRLRLCRRTGWQQGHHHEGEEAIGRYRKSAETTLAFCRHCGSSLFSQKSSSGKINLRLGVLDDVPSQRPAFHIFVGSKAPWHQIGDDCPQFDTRPPV